MNQLKRFLLPVAIIVGAIVVARIMVANRAPAERQQAAPAAPKVQVLALAKQDYPVTVASRGVVQAHTQGSLVSQVGGEVVRVHPEFRDGGYFNAGETLVQIDPRDYRLAVTMAESELAQARQRYAEEQARAEQAQRDWQRLGGDGPPNDLALRKPQLAGAAANLAAAEARLGQARLDLERTRVSVPYAGRVLSKNVAVGQVVGAGFSLGEVYATDRVEVRLPLSNRQLAQLSIPEQYRNAKQSRVKGPRVTLQARIGEQSWEWEGRIVRSAGAIDASSRQTFAVAEVQDPYARREDNAPPLKVGQYVEARIHGELLKDVFVIPRVALRGENTAYVLDAQQRLDERRVDIAWLDDDAVVVRGGLKAGERLVTTVPAGAAPGMLVKVPGDTKAAKAGEESEATGKAKGGVAP